ncbi:darcynin family protein [Dyella humicola]|uniref:darcynin family protein n=1 Tax=Dyella humicola TaxID=2992126 RepID=UPI0022595579|nr:darcynin family protein [Dyella humicola]
MTTKQTPALDQPAITVFMLVKTLPEWLGFSIDERFSQLAKHVEPILQRYRDRVRLRFYDVEFYTARVTDVWVWEAVDHHAYELLVEELRETPFWDRYFAVVEILPGVENAYAKNYGREALPA